MPTITTKNDDGSTSHRLINGRSFTMPRHPDADVDASDVPGTIIEVALQTLNSLADKTQSVNSDLSLSQLGRHRALEPIQRRSLTLLAQLHGQLAFFEGTLDKRTREHLAIPVLPPTHTAGALEDWELRDWWRQAEATDRTAVLRRAGTDAQCERVIVALLRSAVPVAVDAEMKLISSTWAEVRNAAGPEVHEKIEAERRSLAWGKHQLALVASMVYQLVLVHGAADRLGLLRILQEDDDERVQKGAWLYAYQPNEIANTQRILAAERMGR
jgi:hypothetical protein